MPKRNRERILKTLFLNTVLAGGGGDTTAPTVTITSSETSPTFAATIPLTITFSESVTGFVVGDITVSGCTLSGFSGSGAVYTVNATATANAITVDIAGGVCVDGAGNGNTAATQFTITSLYYGLVAWFDFSDITTLFQDSAGTQAVTSDGQNIGKATDKSAAGNSVTQAGASTLKPTYKTNIQNSKSVARFDGGDYLTASFTQAQPVTVIFVANSTTTDRVAVGGTGIGIGVYTTATAWGYQAGNFVNGTVEGINNIEIVSAVFNGASSKLVVNGSTSSTSNPGTNGFVALGVGAYSDSGNKLVGDICEVLVYNSALSDALRGQVQTALNTKWAVF